MGFMFFMVRKGFLSPPGPRRLALTQPFQGFVNIVEHLGAEVPVLPHGGGKLHIASGLFRSGQHGSQHEVVRRARVTPRPPKRIQVSSRNNTFRLGVATV